MYELIKDIANAFQIKCSKYKAEELSPTLRTVLFNEAIVELNVMTTVNEKSREQLNELIEKVV